MKALRIFLIVLFTIASLTYLNAIVPTFQSSACSENTCGDGTGGSWQHWDGKNDGSGGTVDVYLGGKEKINGQDQDCSTGLYNNMSSYAGGVDVFTKNTSKTIKLKIYSQSFFCTKPSQMSGDPEDSQSSTVVWDGDGDQDNKCIANSRGVKSDIITIPAGQHVKYQPDVVQTNSCGFVQWDMSFQILDANNNAVYTAGDIQNPGVNSQAYWTYCYAGINSKKNWCSAPTPTPTNTPTPTLTSTPTPTIPVTPTPSASCYFKPASLQLGKDETGHSTLYFSARNLPNNNKQATICLSVDGKTPEYRADTEIDYSRYPISVDVTAPHTYQAIVYLKNKGDDSHSCSGTTIAACSAQTYLSGTPTPTDTPTPTPTAVTPTQGCTSNCGNITINVHQEQQQQQEVLAATVAPAPTTTSLPSTGADDFAVIPTLLSLIAAGWKLRKLV